MSEKWDDLVKEKSPREKEEEAKKLLKSEKKEEHMPRYDQKKVKLVGGSWGYERFRFDKILGWEKIKETQDSHTYKTGEEIVQTSATTFEIRDKTWYNDKYDIIK